MTTLDVTTRIQQSFDVAAERRAAKQLGLIERDQARLMGATNRMIRWRIDTGRWVPALSDRVFRLGGSPTSWEQSLLAACLGYGPDAVVSHRAAAALWRIPELAGKAVEVTVPRGRRRRSVDAVVHFSDLSDADVTRIGPIPVTTVARTFVDVASLLPANLVEIGLDDALRHKLTTIGRVFAALDRAGRRRGTEDLRAVLHDRREGPIPESALETRLYRLMLDSRLPKPVRQHPIVAGGRLVARVDFAYPDHRLAIEGEGFDPHSDREQFERDRRRATDLMLIGWRVVWVTWRELIDRPSEVIAKIARALNA